VSVGEIASTRLASLSGNKTKVDHNITNQI